MQISIPAFAVNCTTKFSPSDNINPFPSNVTKFIPWTALIVFSRTGESDFLFVLVSDTDLYTFTFRLSIFESKLNEIAFITSLFFLALNKTLMSFGGTLSEELYALPPS